MLNRVQHYLVEVEESPTPEEVPCVGFIAATSLGNPIDDIAEQAHSLDNEWYALSV